MFVELVDFILRKTINSCFQQGAIVPKEKEKRLLRDAKSPFPSLCFPSCRGISVS